MASAFSQSTFLSADNMEPSLPPLYPHPQWDRKRGPSRERQPWLTLFLPPEYLPGPCAGMSIPELDQEASGPGLLAALQAAVWQLEVAGAAGTTRGNRSWLRVGSHEAKVLESISQPHAGTRTVSAELGWGLHEQLPLLSLALELAKEGSG